jgi:hypothetical protein
MLSSMTCSRKTFNRFNFLAFSGSTGGPGGGNPHHADFQDVMLDKLLNVRPRWPGPDLDSNLPGYYLGHDYDDEDE